MVETSAKSPEFRLESWRQLLPYRHPLKSLSLPQHRLLSSGRDSLSPGEYAGLSWDVVNDQSCHLDLSPVVGQDRSILRKPLTDSSAVGMLLGTNTRPSARLPTSPTDRYAGNVEAVSGQ